MRNFRCVVSDRDSGFTSGGGALPVAGSCVPGDGPGTGNTKPEVPEAERVGNVQVGNKELSGHSANHEMYVFSADNPARFVTHYQTR